MMPVVAGRRSTRLQILLYALVLAPLGVAPYFIGMASSFFGAFAAVLGVVFVHRSWKLWRSDSDADAMGLFKYSILISF